MRTEIGHNNIKYDDRVRDAIDISAGSNDFPRVHTNI
jgi:hypothetical protein